VTKWIREAGIQWDTVQLNTFNGSVWVADETIFLDHRGQCSLPLYSRQWAWRRWDD